jgi:hypothetical protein
MYSRHKFNEGDIIRHAHYIDFYCLIAKQWPTGYYLLPLTKYPITSPVPITRGPFFMGDRSVVDENYILGELREEI